jgi:tetratricopeptide (TPR) repeat protein
LGLEVAHFYRANTRLLGYDRVYVPVDGIVSDLQEAIALKPDFQQAHWNLSLVYLDYCNPALAIDEALAEAQKVRELRPADADSYWLLGQIHAEREEWQQAEDAHRQALRLDAAHADAQEGLAKALEQLGRGDEANRAYSLALVIRQKAAEDAGSGSTGDATSEDPAEVQDRLGYAYLNAGQFDHAIASFEEALRLQPENAEYQRHLGNAYYWQGEPDLDSPSSQLEQAIDAYEIARSLDPADGLLLTVLGGAYNEAGRPEDAMRAYEDAVRVAPCDDDAWLLLASQYDSLGRSADAEAACQQLVLLNPRQSVGWQWLAASAYLQGDYSAAAGAYRSGVEAEPQSPALYYGLGVSLYYLGEYEEAEKAYRQAGVLAPDDMLILTGWADTLAALGRMVEAVAAYERAVEHEPDNPYYWEALALGYAALGRPEDVLRAAEETLRNNPDSALAYFLRAGVHEQSGDQEEAQADYQRALDRASQDDPLSQMAEEALERIDG